MNLLNQYSKSQQLNYKDFIDFCKKYSDVLGFELWEGVFAHVYGFYVVVHKVKNDQKYSIFFETDIGTTCVYDRNRFLEIINNILTKLKKIL